MKIDMSYFKFYNSSNILAPGLPVLLVLSLIGCSEGGMIGTGSGPTDSNLNPVPIPNSDPDLDAVYELENLPNRISPDIPETLQNDEVPTPSDNKKRTNFSPRKEDTEPQQAGLLYELNTELTGVAGMRFSIELNTAIIDLAFDDIVNECEAQLLDCTIPANRIRVTVTQDVVNRWLNQFIRFARSLTTTISYEVVGEYIRSTNAEIKSMLNKEVVLGETHYSQLDGAPYEHAIRTSLKNDEDKIDNDYSLFPGEEIFSARWHEDGHVAKFTFYEAGYSSQDYFYQNNVPGELVVSNYTNIVDADSKYGSYVKILGNDPDQAGVLVQAATKGSAYGSSNSLIGRFYDVFEGQFDNNGGYATVDSRSFDLTEEQNLTSRYRHRQSFDSSGKLLAAERCIFDLQFNFNCDDNVFESYGPEGSAITNSVHYFAPEEFDSLVAIQDAVRWKVEGVPGEIKSIAVVSAESQKELYERELLCEGIQMVADDAYIFCTATDEQLENTVVVELDEGIPTRIISTAKLVQIQ